MVLFALLNCNPWKLWISLEHPLSVRFISYGFRYSNNGSCRPRANDICFNIIQVVVIGISKISSTFSIYILFLFLQIYMETMSSRFQLKRCNNCKLHFKSFVNLSIPYIFNLPNSVLNHQIFPSVIQSSWLGSCY